MLLRIENLYKNYRHNISAINNVNIDIHTGVLGLLGPNGAGKTTFLNVISTLIKPSVGKITFNQVDIIKTPQYLRQTLGFLPQSFGLYQNLTGYEFLNYMAAVKGISGPGLKKRIDGILEILNLQSEGQRPVNSYSGGMRQRLGIAQTLLNDPQVLIFDEPTVGLDPEERLRFRELIMQLSENKIVIISSHIVSDLELIAQNIAIINRGSLLKCDSQTQVIESVHGYIFERIIPKTDLDHFEKEVKILSTYQYENSFKVKYMCGEHLYNEKQYVILPTLEDAYLFYIHKSL